MVTFGAVSYTVLAVLYALLALLLLTSWRGPRIGGYLIFACLVTAAWSGLLAWSTASGAIPIGLLFVAEVMKAGGWLIFLGQLGLPSRRVRFLAFGSGIAALLWGLWVLVSNRFLGTTGSIEPVLNFSGLALSLVGLVILEQLYRNAAGDKRPALKALVIGLGGMFAFDLFLYSQAVLLQHIDSTVLMARGAVNILFLPLIALAARRNPSWDLNFFVSRQVVFYTTTLVAVGLYLLLMSAGGYLLLLYGGNWGGLASIVFSVGALLVLAALVFSSSARARTKVFLSKHFFQNKYDYREEWLRLVATLADFEDSSTRQVVIKALAQIVDSPSGTLWRRPAEGGDFVVSATYNDSSAGEDLPADSELVRFIARDGWIVDLDEYRAYPDRYDNLVLPEWLAEDRDAWLIVPLMTRDSLQGLMLLDRGVGHREINYEDRDLLKTVGNHIAVHLAQEEADNMLSEAKQFEAYNRLTAFLMHDLKNLIAQQSMLVENAERHKRNPEFIDDMLETIAGGVTRMRRVIEHLRHTSVSQPRERVELSKLVLKAVSGCEDRNPVPAADVGDEQVWVRGDSERLLMALTHAIRNAQDATPANGEIRIRLSKSGDGVRLEVKDNGEGMKPDFVRERLFKPFDSTKGTQGVGIGAYQILETVRAAGGSVDVSSSPGQGTTMVWNFPGASREV